MELKVELIEQLKHHNIWCKYNQNIQLNRGDIIKVIKTLKKTNNNPDRYGILAEHLNTTQVSISQPLAIIMNDIWKSCLTWTLFKAGLVTPILKKEKQNRPL